EAGYRLVSANRILENTIGLELTGVDSSTIIDPTADGRMSPECRGCHYDGPFALDLMARVLSRAVRDADDKITYVQPSAGPQTLFGGQTISNDKELITALVDSVDFRFRTCRLAFQFLYGRAENQCEATTFDACMTAMEDPGTIQAALTPIVTDASFCD